MNPAHRDQYWVNWFRFLEIFPASCVTNTVRDRRQDQETDIEKTKRWLETDSNHTKETELRRTVPKAATRAVSIQSKGQSKQQETAQKVRDSC